jgi:signal transduction histidine kinase
VSWLRGVGARLSLALALVVAGALALVYLILVPSLQHRLEDARLSQLRREAALSLDQLRGEPIDQDYVDLAATDTNARVVALAPISGARVTTLLVSADSLHLGTSGAIGAIEKDRIALAASQRGRIERGTVSRGETSFAEVAFPRGELGEVVLFSASLKPASNDVELVRNRLIVAGVLALIASIVVGFGAASVFARRLRRLERSAERIAGGDFSEPVVDRGTDEVGELAAAFDRMRARLAQLDDARRAFIANASHELRTPIFALGGFLELMRDEDLDEATRREFVGTMVEQVERLTKLATDLLDLSRLDAGRLRLRRERVALAPLAQTLAEEFRGVAQATGHPVDAVVEEEAAALGDPERALQIGRILVENAVQHTPDGTPVRVVVRGGGDAAELAVEDEGGGIPPDRADQVFQRFTRLDGARSSGSGLGLAIARELAEAMGGTIRLESRSGRTVFTLVLPAAAPDLEPVAV